MKSLLIQFGINVRKIRGSKKLSQEKLADLSGLHRTYISSVERGERNISLINISKIAKALDCELIDLLSKVRKQNVNSTSSRNN